MEQYMAPALFAITIDAMKSDSEDVSLQGIEFWSTVCDEEDNLSYEIDEASKQGRQPSRISKHYVRGALQYLVPILQELMTKQEEVDDDDEWNPCKAAGVCIMLMANVAENDIVDKVMPFIDANIKSADWRYREAAVMCLGSILDGPDEETLSNIVTQALAIMIELLSDSMIPVRDTAAWTIGLFYFLYVQMYIFFEILH
ncbi:Importin subunit beta-1-like [Oopsacas minuta]|uniref:Importin subunit beta-1-like n=1 Tax=Oopsacas minuta TaxID=111878 RepID=A0AAV7JVI8_9METZ|nr:Importin subunit beta-1-like [Oopsacas minuta]